jgi:hypothetical protein
LRIGNMGQITPNIRLESLLGVIRDQVKLRKFPDLALAKQVQRSKNFEILKEKQPKRKAEEVGKPQKFSGYEGDVMLALQSFVATYRKLQPRLLAEDPERTDIPIILFPIGGTVVKNAFLMFLKSKILTGSSKNMERNGKNCKKDGLTTTGSRMNNFIAYDQCRDANELKDGLPTKLTKYRMFMKVDFYLEVEIERVVLRLAYGKQLKSVLHPPIEGSGGLSSQFMLDCGFHIAQHDNRFQPYFYEPSMILESDIIGSVGFLRLKDKLVIIDHQRVYDLL